MLSAIELDAFAATFGVLGRLHIQPADSSTRDAVLSLIDEWPLLPAESEYTSRGCELLKESLKRKETDAAIRTDQDTLYGISARAKVPPFESVHRGDDRLVFDKQTLEVRSEYSKLSLRAPNYNAEPDDHIGLELDFLAQCCLITVDGEERAYELAVSFTNDHINQWAPHMLREAYSYAETAWLKGILALTLGAIETWSEKLQAGGANA
ncbi:molecular chaperone TorD family protein [Arcanobacterium phocisimile]|uniref:Molecular chaperone TorD family protein n=1 Tax=Arcanobacterium phocisimile TaxID=1302235 RepID=A0ABX7IFG2_9ACTO|nr:molecular chaperone TorD family protein [Arcanobacterium phocisimile]QRV01711.1 molecular chaperone TorD family protein [Arcanobacterium phocisimile]